MALPPIATPPVDPAATPSVLTPPSAAGATAKTDAIEKPAAQLSPRPAPQAHSLSDPSAALDTAQRAFSDFGVTFEIDKESDRLVTKVVDRESGKLIRQIPSEEMLKIAARLEAGSITPGSLLDEWA